MNIKFLSPLDEARGEVLSEDLFDQDGKLIFSKNTILNNYTVEKLKNINIKKVPIYPSCEDGIEIYERNLSSIYRESIIAMKKLMVNLISDEITSYNTLKKTVDRLYEKDNEKRQILAGVEEIKDEYTYNHSTNVGLYSMYIAQLLGFNKEHIKDAVKAGLLHDIGKSKIPKSIINKEGKLNDEEFEIIKTHTTIGYEMSKNIPCLKEEIRQAILTHHERKDGSGYPLGLKFEEINIYAEIVAIADVYDALTSERVYKTKITPFEAIEQFCKMGLEKFNQIILSVFFKNIVQCYINSRIKLNDGIVGKIVYIPPMNITKPIIEIDGYYVDLEKNPSLQIVELIK